MTKTSAGRLKQICTESEALRVNITLIYNCTKSSAKISIQCWFDVKMYDSLQTLQFKCDFVFTVTIIPPNVYFQTLFSATLAAQVCLKILTLYVTS